MNTLPQFDAQFTNRITNPQCYMQDWGDNRPNKTTGYFFNDPTHPVLHASLFLGTFATDNTHFIPWATAPDAKTTTINNPTHHYHLKEKTPYVVNGTFSLEAEATIFGYVRPRNHLYTQFVFNPRWDRVPDAREHLDHLIDLSNRFPQLTILLGHTAIATGQVIHL